MSLTVVIITDTFVSVNSIIYFFRYFYCCSLFYMLYLC
nr:MAG TPA: hypothetical protein [Caudoviricetes sp.]